MTQKIPADVVVHGLETAVLFPRPYRGKGTPVGWDVEERHHVSIAGLRGRIVWIGDAARLHDEVKIAGDAELIDGRGLVAIPGFVDAHTHLVYAGNRADEFEMRVRGRTYLEIMSAGGGILRSVEAVRTASEDELLGEVRERLWRAVTSGVTTVEIKSGYGLDLESELKMLRVVKRLQEEQPVRIIPTFMGAHAIPADRKADPDAFVDELCREWIPEVARQGLATFNDVFCEAKAFSVEQSRRILRAGLEHGLRPKIHADEIQVIGGVDLAVELGAVSADHLLKTRQDGIRKLAGSGVVPTLLPGTSTYLMEKDHADARGMIDAGLPVAIASDHNPGSCQFLEATLIQSLAMLQLKLSAGEALIAGTLHAAHALGLGSETGALEVGRSFDAALLDVESFREIGYRIGDAPVEAVLCGGVMVCRHD